MTQSAQASQMHTSAAPPLFNPASPEFICDPYPAYHRLRETEPVHRSPLGMIVASRHADVSLVLRDPRFGKDFVDRMTRRHGEQIFDEPVYRSMRHWMLQQDPPDHARLRGLVLTLELSPQPVKLSEVRQLEVRLTVTNKGRREVPLDFPNEQRIEIYLRNPAENILTKWSDNHAFADEPGTVLINPGEHVDYTTTIATRELAPNKVFIAEVFLPSYPELTIRQKFLTAP